MNFEEIVFIDFGNFIYKYIVDNFYVHYYFRINHSTHPIIFVKLAKIKSKLINLYIVFVKPVKLEKYLVFFLNIFCI